VNDPYCWPETECLRNRFGIRDPSRLANVEARIVSVRDAQAAREPIPGEYNLEHLCTFHRRLFRDVYEWAGETRTVDIAKPGARFCRWLFVDEEVGAVLSGLPEEGFLLGLKRHAFVDRLAHYYGELNARHPFREGNGRTQRAFLRQLAASAGWRLDWSETNADENIRACRANLLTGDTALLKCMLGRLVTRL
jgi:cell filamentation protein